MKVAIKRVDTSQKLPAYEFGASGFDLFCRKSLTISPREIALVPVNVVIKVPVGYVLFIFLRSSIAIKKGVILANGVGVIDSFNFGDRDEIIIQLFNITEKSVKMRKGEKIAQGILIKQEQVAWGEVETHGSKGRGYKIKKKEV